MIIGLLAILASVVVLAVLGWLDPKRLRAEHRLHRTDEPRAAPLTGRSRLALAWLAIAPGLALALWGAWHSFLLWLGAACVLGWMLAQALAPGR